MTTYQFPFHRSIERRVDAAAPAALVVLLLLLVSGIGGCGTTIRNDSQHEMPADAPDYDEIRDRQNTRIERLRLLESAGVLEMQWTDERGRERFEPQIDITLLYEQPRRLALRLYKFETVMWLGSDDYRYWLFDLLSSEQTTAYVGQWGSADTAAVSTVLHPMTLLDLVGLFAMPAEGEVHFDQQRGAWSVVLSGRGGPIVAFFDPTDLRPVAVEVLDSEGEVVARSALSDYIRVEARGMPISEYPRLPRRIEVHDLQNQGIAKVTLDGPTTQLNPARLEQAVDFDRLLSRLRPDEVRALDSAPSLE